MKDVYNAKIKNIEDKIPDITNLGTTLKDKIPDTTNLAADTTLNAEINEVKNKIPNSINFDTTTALIAVENKIPDHGKYITTPN